QWQRKRRGTSTRGLNPSAFVAYIENHDQVANSGFGRRSYYETAPGRHRAMIALMLLAPSTPMLFQGQEFDASTPFLYFCDVSKDLHDLVRQGRVEFLSQFPSIASEAVKNELALPYDPATFERSKLDFMDRERHREIYDMHRDLLRLRREDPAFSAQQTGGVDGAVLGGSSFVLRFFHAAGDRLLLANFGRAESLAPAPEPLLAPL